MEMTTTQAIRSLSRFQIESLLIYDYVGRNYGAGAELAHISYSSFYHDLTDIFEKTGLDPRKDAECDRLLEMVNEIRKEKMGKYADRPDARRYFG